MYAYLRHTARRGLSLFWTLAKIMVPIMVVVRVADVLGLVDVLGGWAGPLMAPVGLPAEIGLAWVACLLVGPPAGIAAMAVLAEPLTTAQVSIFATMMLIGHALPLESAIVARAGGSFWANVALRAGGAYAFGIIANLFFLMTGWLSEPVDLSHIGGAEETGWLGWLISSAQLLALVFAIILVLLVILDVMEKTGVTALFTRGLRPILRAAGMTEQTTPLVTIGMLLGLTYGAGLIIKEIEEKGIPPRAKALALSWLSLCHSIIEDTGLVLIIGASLWVVVLGRVLFALAAVRLIAAVRDLQGMDRAELAAEKKG
ncbi:MAG: nucleoside recognition domain-containing protein [Pseudomonadota bacterium]